MDLIRSLIILMGVFPFILQFVEEVQAQVKFDDNKVNNDLSNCGKLLDRAIKQSKPNSKYVAVPTDFGIEHSNINGECEAYGLELPSAYNIKDWLSLQEIGKDFLNLANRSGDPHISPCVFFLGNHYDHTAGKWVGADGDNKDLYTIWESTILREPDNDRGKESQACARFFDPPYYDMNVKKTGRFMSTGDIDFGIYKSSFGLVCQYPRKSICFSQSVEEKEFEVYTKTMLFTDGVYFPLKFLGITESGYWWTTVIPKVRNEAIMDCINANNVVKDEDLKISLWEGPASKSHYDLLRDKDLELLELRSWITTTMLELGLHPNPPFTGAGPNGLYSWDKDKSDENKAVLLASNADGRNSPLFSLCFGKWNEEDEEGQCYP